MNKVYFFGMVFILLFSCKKVQPKMSDPLKGCDCAHEVNATFTIEEMSSPYPEDALFTETDTSYTKKNVRFTATEVNTTYKWYIGQELLTTKSVTRYFDNTLDGQTIAITLVVKKEVNKICFPNDDGYDSITKYISFVKKGYDPTYTSVFTAPQPKFEGTYRVKEENGSDSVDFTLDFVLNVPPTGQSLGYVLFHSDQDDIFNFYLQEFHWNYKEIKKISGISTNTSQIFITTPFNLKLSGNSIEISTGKWYYSTAFREYFNYKGRKL